MKENTKKDSKKKSSYWLSYFVFFILSFLLAFAFMLVKTGGADFNLGDPLFLRAILVSFLGLAAIYFIAKLNLNKSFKCSLCGNPGKDLLKPDAKKAKRLCRKHLLEIFRQEFLGNEHKMVVVYPGLEDRTKSYYHYYCFYTPLDLKKYNFTEIAGKLLEKGLKAVSGKCKECGDLASIAYFGKDSFQWVNDYPAIEKINQDPEIICNKCALELILPSLRGFKGDFFIPIDISSKGEGIFFTWSE